MTALAQSQIPLLQANIAALQTGTAGDHCDGSDAGQASRSFLPEWTNGDEVPNTAKRWSGLTALVPPGRRDLHSLHSNQPFPPKDPPSLGRLARRISRWTTNCLLTAMLLVIALGFGREVLHWWHDDAPPRPAASAGSSAAPGTRLRVAGSIRKFSRSAIRTGRSGGRSSPASQAEVPAALLAFCRTAISNALPRGELADAAEQDVLSGLAAEKPGLRRNRAAGGSINGAQGSPIVESEVYRIRGRANNQGQTLRNHPIAW